MVTKAQIQDFLSQPAIAIYGVSRSGKKFGNSLFRELQARGVRVYAIHPSAETLEGVQAYPNLAAVPEKVGGVVAVVPPAETEKVAQQAAEAGVGRIWMQLGADSPEAVRAAEGLGLQVIHGECMIMHLDRIGSFHRFHKWVRTLTGGMPK